MIVAVLSSRAAKVSRMPVNAALPCFCQRKSRNTIPLYGCTEPDAYEVSPSAGFSKIVSLYQSGLRYW
ncbi:MAG: hypothetical protein BWY06_02303 [Candidatus Latescibacteria bacterium ADurb.Bin168]|nr:MAG: hypothetical protein BWY06_02303 [Candidatus Latescibacteria bacterium ADurb.Bin168]